MAWKFEVCSYISQKLLTIYTIKVATNGISRILIKFLQDFLKDRRVVLKGQCFSWALTKAGVP